MTRCTITIRNEDLNNTYYARIEWPTLERDEEKVNVLLTRSYKSRDTALGTARKLCKRLKLEYL